MKLKDGFALREVAGEYMAVPFDESYNDVGALIMLNETGAFLWKKLEEETSFDVLISALKGEYEITDEEAKNAVRDFTDNLKAANLLK